MSNKFKKTKIVSSNSHFNHHSYSALSSRNHDLLNYMFFFFSFFSSTLRYWCFLS